MCVCVCGVCVCVFVREREREREGGREGGREGRGGKEGEREREGGGGSGHSIVPKNPVLALFLCWLNGAATGKVHLGVRPAQTT